MSLKHTFDCNGQTLTGQLRIDNDIIHFENEDDAIEYRFEIVSRSSNSICLKIIFDHDGVSESRHIYVSRNRNQFQLRNQEATFYATLATGRSSADEVQNDLVAPMPGFIRKVFVKEGDEVSKGDRLVILEAMKMEHTLSAPFGGTVSQVFFAEGDRVGPDEVIVKIEPKAE